MSHLPIPAACQPLRLACRDRKTRAALLRRSITRIGAGVPLEVCYTFCGESARMLRLLWSGSGAAVACFKHGGESLDEKIGRLPAAYTKRTAKYSFFPKIVGG